MEFVDNEQAQIEAQEVYDAVWGVLQSLPERLMKSKLWANSATNALLNILVRICFATETPRERYMEMATEIWDKFAIQMEKMAEGGIVRN